MIMLLLLLPYIASARCSQLQMSRQESKELERSKKKDLSTMQCMEI